jgi:RecB family exonuclease
MYYTSASVGVRMIKRNLSNEPTFLRLRNTTDTDLPALTDKQKLDCQNIIKKYLKREDLNESKVLFVEKPFYIQIDDLLVIKGYIDRIDKLNEDNYQILDYKTSKSASSIDKTQQLSLYSAALKRIVGRKDITIMRVLDFLKIGKISRGEYDHSREDDMFEEIKAVGRKIRELKALGEDENWKATPNDFCWCCDFKRMCDNDVAKNSRLLNEQA